jgi:putative ABC transport system permease protein
VLLYRLSAGVALAAGLLAVLGAAGLGAAFAVRRAVSVAPAEAMRPEPPARYHRSVFERPALARRIGHAARMVLRNLERHPWRAAASLVGIAVAVGIFFFGVLFMNVMTQLADVHFTISQRQDVTVTFVVPVSSGALHELRSLPGVIHAEPVRRVAARIRHGSRSRYLAVTGALANARLERVVTLHGQVVTLPEDGLVISAMLGEILGVAPGDEVEVEVLEGERPVRRIPVAAFVDDALGLSAYLEIDALHRLLREGGTLSGANLLVEASEVDALYHRLKAMPKVSGVALKDAAVESFQRLMAENFEIITTFNVIFAGIIAFGVVYNAARISLSERTRELATLRVLGFTIGEIAFILLGELALLTVIAMPVGVLFGWGLGQLVVMMFQSEVYRLPLVFTPQNAASSALTVIAAGVLSGLTVKRQLDRLDLVAVLKMSE